MCNKDLEDLYNLAYIIYYFETQDMCIEAIREELHLLEFVTNRFQTKKICNKAGRKNSFQLQLAPIHLNTQEMCQDARKNCPWFFMYVPDCYEKLYKIWNEYYLHAVTFVELAEWYRGYKKPKAQKKQTDNNFLPIA